MAEQLQELLDRIQKDGIDKAEANATRVEEETRTRAAALISEAEEKAMGILAKAEKDAQLFVDRGNNALKQAARDAVLSVGDAVNRALAAIVEKKVGDVLTDDGFADVVKSAVLAYCSAETGETDIELLLPEDQKDKTADFLIGEMAGQMKNGLTISGDKSVISGFTVSLKGSGIQHDFTGEAITDALCKLLRPHLAEIVKTATAEEKSE